MFWSNRGALSADEVAGLAGTATLCAVPVYERTESVARIFGHGRFAVLLRKLLIVVSPVMLVLNVLVMWRRLGNWHPDVLVSCNGGYPAAESALAAVLAARLRKIPSVLVVMSQPQPRRRILPGYDWLLDRLVLAAVDRVILNSKRQGSVLAMLRGADVARLRTVYNGIPDSLVRRSVPPMTGPEVVMGVTCRLDPMKGLDYLIRALPPLVERYPLRLRVVGEGAYRQELEQLAEQLGVADRVCFAGFLSGQALVDELMNFDLYVFPSLWEGLPYSLLEAMRAGLPIVSTNVGGIPEAIGDNEGLLVSPASSEELQRGIEAMLSDPNRARELGRAARARYEAQFVLSKMQADFANVIAQTAGLR
jgi:glycosyltransferase involved in cell wall biosynthesis